MVDVHHLEDGGAVVGDGDVAVRRHHQLVQALGAQGRAQRVGHCLGCTRQDLLDSQMKNEDGQEHFSTYLGVGTLYVQLCMFRLSYRTIWKIFAIKSNLVLFLQWCELWRRRCQWFEPAVPHPVLIDFKISSNNHEYLTFEFYNPDYYRSDWIEIRRIRDPSIGSLYPLFSTRIKFQALSSLAFEGFSFIFMRDFGTLMN